MEMKKMSKGKFYNDLFERFIEIVKDNNLMDTTVKVTGRPLTSKEAIGETEKKDFPILKGKEKISWSWQILLIIFIFFFQKILQTFLIVQAGLAIRNQIKK